MGPAPSIKSMNPHGSGSQPLYISDFITGLFAALSLRGVKVLSVRDRRIDKAMGLLHEDLSKLSAQNNLDLQFKIIPHRVHQDSVALNEALYQAAKRELISYDNPEFLDLRLKIGPDEADQYLKRVPGSRAMYVDLATKFLDCYQRALE